MEILLIIMNCCLIIANLCPFPSLGQTGIKSLAVDWLSGQLYWTNSVLKGIYTGASDGSAVGIVMSKETDPTELVVLPTERCVLLYTHIQ